MCGNYYVRDQNAAFVFRFDPHGGFVAVGTNIHCTPGLKDIGASAMSCVQQHAIYNIASKRAPKGVARGWRHASFNSRSRCKKCHSPDFRPRFGPNSIACSETAQEIEIHRRHELAADLSTREVALLYDCDPTPLAGQCERGRGTARTRADNDGIVHYGEKPARRLLTQKMWVNGPIPRSSI